MGEIVLGIAAPHNPNITSEPEKMSDPIREKVYGAFGALQKSLNEASPDCLLVLTSDHVTNFFYHNAPMFCLAVSDTCTGPAPKEIPRLKVPRATLKVETEMAKGLLHYGIDNGIDFAFSHEMVLDHAFMVPLSFVTPRMDLPIVPFHINSLLSPRPSAPRCYRLGQQLGEYVRHHYRGKVAVLASGSFSGDIGGPKMGSVDIPFDQEFFETVKQGRPEEMVRKATPETIERAGVANEILVWITLLGMMGSIKPSFTEYVCEKGWSTAATLGIWHPGAAEP